MTARTWTRGRFLKRSVAAAGAFVVAGRALAFGDAASAHSMYLCEFLSCHPIQYECYNHTLYLYMLCYDAFSGAYCGDLYTAVGCC